MTKINVKVAYATLEKQMVIDINIEQGSTVKQAIEKSNIQKYFKDISLTSVGIYSKKCTLDDIVNNGDRVEIYRELQVTKKLKPTNKINVETN